MSSHALFRLLGLLLAAALAVFDAAGQSVAITTPTPNQVVSGTSLLLTATLTSLPAAYTAEYDVNGETACIATAPPFSCSWNTYYTFGGAGQSVTVTVRDASNTPLATSPPVTFNVQNNQPIPYSAASQCAITPGTSFSTNWSGSVNISYSCGASVSGEFIYVDGKLVYQNYNTSGSYNLDTTQFDNGVRNVVVTWSSSGTTPPNWTTTGQIEKQVTFSNGTTAMELRANAEEVFLCTSSQPQCPTSFALTARMYRADGSSVAAGSLTFSSNNTSVATVGSSNGIVTQAGVGNAQITILDSSGKSRSVWVYVNAQNILPHFGADGSILTAYNPAKSVFINSVFFSDNLGDQNYPFAFSYGTDYLNSGFNTIEDGVGPLPVQGQSQTAWQSAFSSYVSGKAAQAQPYGLLYHLIGDDLMRGTGDVFSTTRGTGASYSPTSVNYVLSQWSGKAVGISMVDEANYIWGEDPLQGNVQIGTNNSNCTTSSCFTQLVCVAGGNCTVTWSNWTVQSGTYTFIILGSSHSLLNSSLATANVTVSAGVITGCNITTSGSGYQFPVSAAVIGGGGSGANVTVTTANGHISGCSVGSGGSGYTGSTLTLGIQGPVYQAARVDANTFTFPNPGAGSFTSNSTNDPGLTIEPYVAWWCDHTNYCGSPSFQPSDYIRHDAFSYFMSQVNSVSGRPAITWPVSGGYDQESVQNWMGDSRMSDYWEAYTGTDSEDYLPQFNSSFNLISQFGGVIRQKYGYLTSTRLSPMLAKAEGTALDYGFQSYAVGITSIDNDTVTFTGPHGITNVQPWSTRLSITGSSNSSYNKNFYVRSCPTATTCTIAYSGAQFTSGINGSNIASATFWPSGAVLSVDSLNAGQGIWDSTVNGNVPSDPSCNFVRHRGETVTFTGAGIGNWATTTWYYIPAPLNSTNDNGGGPCSGGHGGYFAQLPSGASTGGTAAIVADNSYLRGRNYFGPGNSELGGRFMFAAGNYLSILGAAGRRVYQMSVNPYQDDPRYHSATGNFGDTSVITVQAGLHPRYTYGLAQVSWHANLLPAKLARRFLKFEFQPRLNSPDYGQFIECGSRTGSYGNLLMCQSFADGTLTRTIDLAACVVSGQSTVRYYATWQGVTITSIAPGTATDTVTFEPAGWVAYLCANSASLEYTPLQMSLKLGDVPNAVRILIQYGYSPYMLSSPQLSGIALPQTIDCGSGSCALPVDKNIGTVYYRVLYLDAIGRVIATGDLQTI